VGGEDRSGGLLERPSELGDPAAALGERLEVAQQLRVADLVLERSNQLWCSDR
jgi:hypothetical protein